MADFLRPTLKSAQGIRHTVISPLLPLLFHSYNSDKETKMTLINLLLKVTHLSQSVRQHETLLGEMSLS